LGQLELRGAIEELELTGSTLFHCVWRIQRENTVSRDEKGKGGKIQRFRTSERRFEEESDNGSEKNKFSNLRSLTWQ